MAQKHVWPRAVIWLLLELDATSQLQVTDSLKTIMLPDA